MTDISHVVKFRIPPHLLDKWDSFIKQNGISNRTAFIINACNHYMLNFNLASKKEVELADLKDQYEVLSSQMGTILEKMQAQVNDDEITKEDPRIKAQILNYLNKVGSGKSDDMFGIIGVSHENLLAILTQMKRDGLITVNKNQEWMVKK